MAGAPAAILEYKMLLRLDPLPKMVQQKNGNVTLALDSLFLYFFLGNGELTSIFVQVSDSQTLACIQITWIAV